MVIARDYPNFFGTTIISGIGKTTDFNFLRSTFTTIGTKAHEKLWEKQPRL